MKDTPIQLCPQLEFMFMIYCAPTYVNQALKHCISGGGGEGKQGIGELGSEVFCEISNIFLFIFLFLFIFFFYLFFFFLGGGVRVDVNGEVRFL